MSMSLGRSMILPRVAQLSRAARRPAQYRSTRVMASQAPPPPAFHALMYEYVPDILEKRDPYRARHLAAAAAKADEGKMVIAGALTDPVDGALFVWKGASMEEIEAYVASDPYVKAGLVPSYKIKPYMVVAGFAKDA